MKITSARPLRLIARLDVKGPDLIKGIQLEGVRKVGEPRAFARRYYQQGVDEIIYLDAVASLYNRDTLADIVKDTAEEVFVPITVGGGLRSIEDVQNMLRAGADKVCVNSAATQRPEFITELAQRFGSQCVVLQIDAKKREGGWEALRDCGREHTGLDVIEWAERGAALGAGEILLTSVDFEGTRKGFDTKLLNAVCAKATVPVIASGGLGSLSHFDQAVDESEVDAVAVAHMFHYNKLTIQDMREHALKRGCNVRRL